MTSKKIKTFQDILDAAGGSMALAMKLKCGQTSVLNWKRWGIPRKYWADLILYYDFSADDLFTIDEDLRWKDPK